VGFNQFYAVAFASVLLQISFRPTLTLGLQLVITKMSQEGRNLVGTIRAFSSMGFAITSFLVGPLFAFGGYISLFMSAVVGYSISIGLTGSLPQSTSEPSQPNPPAMPRTRGFYILILSMFFLQMGNRAGYDFWYLHFQENLGISTDEIGRFAGIMALVEIPSFVLLDRLLKRVDVRLTFILGGIGMAAVWFAVGIVPNRFWIYTLLVLRGFVFAVFYLSTFMIIVRVSVPANVATNQALMQGTTPSLAALLTSSLSGWVYEHIGATTLFTSASIVSLIGVAVVVGGYKVLVPPTKAVS
jgi:predicted MFS family arabinose efflux permease